MPIRRAARAGCWRRRQAKPLRELPPAQPGRLPLRLQFGCPQGGPRYTYTKSGFESEVILTASPSSRPRTAGLTGDRSPPGPAPVAWAHAPDQDDNRRDCGRARCDRPDGLWRPLVPQRPGLLRPTAAAAPTTTWRAQVLIARPGGGGLRHRPSERSRAPGRDGFSTSAARHAAGKPSRSPPVRQARRAYPDTAPVSAAVMRQQSENPVARTVKAGVTSQCRAWLRLAAEANRVSFMSL